MVNCQVISTQNCHFGGQALFRHVCHLWGQALFCHVYLHIVVAGHPMVTLYNLTLNETSGIPS